MTDETRNDTETATGATTGAGTETAAGDTVAALEAQAAELREQLLRTLADMENLRRRTEREIRDARQYAVTGFARDLLQVGDNLRRALDAVPAEARAAADQAVTALLDGVEMTERGLISTLEKHGVRKISPTGEKFDPNFHQAIYEVPNPEVVAGTVLQVMQDGYVIGERVLRPAMVGVARGGPKSAPAASDPAASAEAPDAAPRVDKTA